MELENPSHGGGGGGGAGADLLNPSNDAGGADDVDSSCSTPYVSAPSSPGRCGASAGWFFSAPASPMHFVLSSQPYQTSAAAAPGGGGGGDVDFEFSARFVPSGVDGIPGSMISADEIFLNGQIRPMKLSSHLQRPQHLAPLLDLDREEDEGDATENASSTELARGRDLRLRSGSVHRRARSMSPLRNPSFHWHDDEEAEGDDPAKVLEADPGQKLAEEPTPSASASSSRSSSSSSSSSSRSSKRWIFLKDLLYRSKSEGRDRGTAKERFWSSISFSPSSKERSKPSNPPLPPGPRGGAAESKRTPRVAAAAAKRASAHERHYAANRAHAEEMRRRTFLPYRQGLLGCLGFSSRGYGAFHGLAKTLNPVSSSTISFRTWALIMEHRIAASARSRRLE